MRKLVVLLAMPSDFDGIILNQTNFAKAKQYLGTQHFQALYDMRSPDGVCLHLEALAIIAGTIMNGGTLFLVCPDFAQLSQIPDSDSLRWNDGKLITTPNFYRYFQKLIQKYQFSVTMPRKQDFLIPTSGQKTQMFCEFTPEQQQIFEQLPKHLADIHLILADRGRGKSTLAGQLAKSLAEHHSVIITAKSRAALPQFLAQLTDIASHDSLQFMAPDQLIASIAQKCISPNHWLFIDEAASLPLPMLQTLCRYFHKVVLTTTTHNYEGTGRGFSLRFKSQCSRTYQEWYLTTPLRWEENDPLEQFINELLLLDESEQTEPLAQYYQLFANAHYKTTPTDLRRLFDGENQQCFSYQENGQLIGAIWALNEGGLSDTLTEQVWAGTRRPTGNLVAQYLCAQGNLKSACTLHSMRISRIAVQPEKQQQGIGKRLVSDFILQISKQIRPLDFISVSFGMSDCLLKFWQQCGFVLVQITPNREASSGYQSAMMLYPISEVGKQFVAQAVAKFQRDAALLPYCEALFPNKVADYALDESDQQNLHGFAFAQRSFSACFASLKRLYTQYPEKLAILRDNLEQNSLTLATPQKQTLAQFRLAVRDVLAAKCQ